MRDERTIYDIFIKMLYEAKDTTYHGSSVASVFLSLFRILPEERLERDLHYLKTLRDGTDDFFKKDSKDCWFEIWHKSIRQCDYFDNTYQTVTLELISDEEDKERKHLWHRFNRTKDPEDKHSKEEGQLFVPDYKKLLDLNEKRRHQEKDYGLNGSLDSILWNMVHVDKEGVLHEMFEDTFVRYDKLVKKGLIKEEK